MTKHTAGPWEWMGDYLRNEEWEEVLEVKCEGGWEGCTSELKVSDADRALIQAAPDLLSALEKALRESGCDGDLCMHDWHDDARAALAKANGEAP